MIPFETKRFSGSNPPDRLETIEESSVTEQPQPEDTPKQELAEDDGHGASSEPISALQAAWNVTNAIQGMFIVGLPIAVKVRDTLFTCFKIFIHFEIEYVCM